MNSLEDTVLNAVEAQSPTSELDALQQLKQASTLSHGKCRKISNADDDFLEQEFLHQSPGQTDPFDFPSQLVTEIIHDPTIQAKFVSYVFERRYGWSEADSSKLCRVKQAQHKHQDVRYKSSINEALDHFIQLLLLEEISEPVLQCLHQCISLAQTHPVVRKQAVIHLMEWLKTKVQRLDDSCFPLLKTTVILGLTDVWSAIRSACVGRLGSVIEHLSLVQLHSFFENLLQICESEHQPWQAKEGAISAVHTIIRRFQWLGYVEDDNQMDEDKQEFFLRFGQIELQGLPQFITSSIQRVTFTLLAHPQLTVREHAIKAYAAYISRSDSKEALLSFQQVLTQLCRGMPASQVLPEQSPLQTDYVFLDAYEAESLLGLCINLVKHLPASQLLPQWSQYFSTFCLYLAHPASAVRQTASDVFKFLVAKESSNPQVLRLVLQGLSAAWEPNMRCLTRSPDPMSSTSDGENTPTQSLTCSSPIISVTNINKPENRGRGLCSCWEWREGRLFAYELILKFLVKNHCLYTFGASTLGESAGPGGGRQGGPGSDSKTSKEPNARFHHSFKHASSGDKLSSSASIASNSQPAESGEAGSVAPVGIRARRPRYSISSCSAAHDLPPNPVYTRVSCSPVSSSAGAADLLSESTQQRMPTISGGSPSIHTLGRHFSYYRNGGAGSPEGKPKYTGRNVLTRSTSTHTTSLLMQTLNSDRASQSDAEDAVKNSHDCLPRLGSLLSRIMYHCMECVTSSRWELRRMSQQLLPVVAEVMRWYDMNLLCDILDERLKPTTSISTYGACLMIKYSLEHATRLQELVHDPPPTWQDRNMCCGMIRCIVENIRHKLSKSVGIIHDIMMRPIRDKLTVVTLQILMIVHTHFNIAADEKSRIEQSMIATLQSILDQQAPSSGWTGNKAVVEQVSVMPVDGFLSCCVKPGNHQICSQQVERHFLTECHTCLVGFIESAPTSQTHVLLPQMTAVMHRYTQDEQLCKLLIDTVCALTARCDQDMSSLSGETQTHVRESCAKAISNLANIVSNKTVDTQTSRQLLELYIQLSCLVPCSQHITHLLKAITTRLPMIPEKKAPVKAANHGELQLDLELMSNDIQESGLPDLTPGLSDEEEENLDLKDGIIAESQILNTSGSTTMSPRCTQGELTDQKRLASVSANSDDDSDWDSWDDDVQEEQSTMTAAFSECLLKLKNKEQNTQDLKSAVNQLTGREKDLVLSLMQGAAL